MIRLDRSPLLDSPLPASSSAILAEAMKLAVTAHPR
jgi:hypothetical protein